MANKLTQSAGLAFNVNTVKAHMKSYFETQALAQPMFSHSQVAMTSLIQKMCDMLLRDALKYATKDKSGMKTVTRPMLKTAVCLNTDLHEYFYQKMLRFDRNQMYADQLPVAKKEFDAMCTGVDKSLILTAKACNFLTYLLLKVYLDVLSTSHQFMSFAKKKTLDASVVQFAIKNRFCDNISHDLCTEVGKAMAAVGEEVEAVAEAEDKDTNKVAESGAEDSGDEAEPVAAADAPKKGGKGTKKGAKAPAAEAVAPAEAEADGEAAPAPAAAAEPEKKGTKKAPVVQKVEVENEDEVIGGDEAAAQKPKPEKKQSEKPKASAPKAEKPKTAAKPKAAAGGDKTKRTPAPK